MAEEVHAGRGGRKSKLPRWQFVLLVVVIVVVALGLGMAVRWLADNNEQAEEPPAPLATELQEVQNLALQGKQEEADAKIAEGLANPDTPDDVKYTLYLQQGASFYNKGEYQPALDAYTAAFDIRERYDVAQSIASTWQQLGNNQKAIEYLRRAVELVPQDNPVRDEDIRLIEEQIQKLEAES